MMILNERSLLWILNFRSDTFSGLWFIVLSCEIQNKNLTRKRHCRQMKSFETFFNFLQHFLLIRKTSTAPWETCIESWNNNAILPRYENMTVIDSNQSHSTISHSGLVYHWNIEKQKVQNGQDVATITKSHTYDNQFDFNEKFSIGQKQQKI